MVATRSGSITLPGSRCSHDCKTNITVHQLMGGALKPRHFHSSRTATAARTRADSPRDNQWAVSITITRVACYIGATTVALRQARSSARQLWRSLMRTNPARREACLIALIVAISYLIAEQSGAARII